MRLLFLLPVLCAAQHIANLNQITHGGQNAEAYWSPDGKRLIFQSTRDGRECDQQYIMNAADGSGLKMVSTGKGVTTCGYFVDDKTIVYASTHEGGDACPARPDRSKGYVWAVYPTFDIYLATDAGKILKKLTTAPGYDAEATINWKTKKIIYTSLESGDLDLWTMNEDGSHRKRITTSEGYDGGAVFSRDGKKIVWRAHHPDTPEKAAKAKELLKENLTTPMNMELFVANADGSDAKQITKFGCASFAPTFSPNGKKILFSSNKHKCDSSDFELYLINVDGTGLEQVTDYGVFTSFPEFSPDGSKLVFASSYKSTSKYEFNIFTADWKTMKTLLALLACASLTFAQAPQPPKKKKLLAIGAVAGFQHDSVSNGLATMWKIGHDTGLWDTYIRTDTQLITKKKLAAGNAKNLDYFDAIYLYTTGELPLDDEQKASLLSFVHDDGKGIIGGHSAIDTFYKWPEYGEMMGAYFDQHPWGQFMAPIIIEDPNFPAMKDFPKTFMMMDEIYQPSKEFSREKVRVLARLDENKIDLSNKNVHRTDKDFAVAWVKTYGNGRVFYSTFGHREEVYDRPDIQAMYREATKWAMKLIDGDATPRPRP